MTTNNRQHYIVPLQRQLNTTDTSSTTTTTTTTAESDIAQILPLSHPCQSSSSSSPPPHLWSTKISIGTPPQDFIVAVDTGKADLWVPSTSCKKHCRKQWSKYNATASETFIETGGTTAESRVVTTGNGTMTNETAAGGEFLIEKRDDGSKLSGQTATDVVRLGPITIPSQTFGQVTTISSSIPTCDDVDGVLGLGFRLSSSPHANTSTILSNLLPQLKNPLFSLYLDTNSTSSSSSELILGGVDQRRYEGCLAWHKIHENSAAADDYATSLEEYWTMTLTDVTAGDDDEESIFANTKFAVLDSGSDTIVGPTVDVTEYVRRNGASCYALDEEEEGRVKVDCSTETGYVVAEVDCERELKPLTFKVDGEAYTLTQSDLVQRKEDEGGTTTTCRLRLTPSDFFEFWVLGDPWFGRYYTAFDIKKRHVGLAPAVQTRVADKKREICRKDLHYDVLLSGEETIPEMVEEIIEEEEELLFGEGVSEGVKRGINETLIAFMGVTAVMAFVMMVVFAKRRRRRMRSMGGTLVGIHRNAIPTDFDMETLYDDWGGNTEVMFTIDDDGFATRKD